MGITHTYMHTWMEWYYCYDLSLTLSHGPPNYGDWTPRLRTWEGEGLSLKETIIFPNFGSPPYVPNGLWPHKTPQWTSCHGSASDEISMDVIHRLWTDMQHGCSDIVVMSLSRSHGPLNHGDWAPRLRTSEGEESCYGGNQHPLPQSKNATSSAKWYGHIRPHSESYAMVPHQMRYPWIYINHEHTYIHTYMHACIECMQHGGESEVVMVGGVGMGDERERWEK